jgi:hypothetical protein
VQAPTKFELVINLKTAEIAESFGNIKESVPGGSRLCHESLSFSLGIAAALRRVPVMHARLSSCQKGMLQCCIASRWLDSALRFPTAEEKLGHQATSSDVCSAG